MDEWISVIQRSIGNALNSQPNSNKAVADDGGAADLKNLQEKIENRNCADCGSESTLKDFCMKFISQTF
jgi:hypothetical protein